MGSQHNLSAVAYHRHIMRFSMELNVLRPVQLVVEPDLGKLNRVASRDVSVGF
jgi:hypothetical protein